MKMSLSLILILAFLINCQNTFSPFEPELGEEIEIKYGEQIVYADEGLRVEFTELLVDSRCPKGVICVCAGNAKISIQFSNHETTLNTYLDPKKTTISEYNIQLIELMPYPIYKGDIDKEDYVAKLLISKV